MRIEVLALGLSLLLLVAVGHPVVYSAVAGEDLAYEPRFSVEDAEFFEVVAVCRSINQVCARGDVSGLAALLTPAYAEYLSRRLEDVDRQATPETLRAMQRLVPLAEEPGKKFVLGRARGPRVAVTFYDLDIGSRPAASVAVCVTLIPLLWTGKRFQLDRPRFRQVVTTQVRAAADELAESWLSAGAVARYEGMGYERRPDSLPPWPTISPR